MAKTPQRSIKYAFDLTDVAQISSEQILGADIDFCQALRHKATENRHSETPVVCGKCGHPVYVKKNGLTAQFYFEHYQGAPQNCPWYSGQPISVDQASARQFDGAQESPLHRRLKYLIGDLLEADENAADVVVDKKLKGEDSYKRPDIRATYAGRPIAIELQISSTQLPIILEREKFYCAENRALIWLGWNIDPGSRKLLSQSYLDIATRHRDNLFSIDENVIRRSRETSRFFFRSFWWIDDIVHTKEQTLDEMVFPEKGLPFSVDKPSPWHVTFKRNWTEVTPHSGSSWLVRKNLWSDLLSKMDVNAPPTHFESDYPGMESLLNLLLSIENGKIVGSDVTPNFHPVVIRASALLLPTWAGEARGCVA